MTLDRRAIFTSGAAAALLAASGVSAQAVPRSGGRLRAALSGAARTDNWDLPASGTFMQAVRHTVFEALTEVAADGTLRGALATSWQADAGGRIWTFDLREGVTFHDGTPLTALDVAASLGACARASGNGQVVLELEEARADAPYALSQKLIARADGPGYVGTGLYCVQKFDPGRHFIGARVNSHYRDGQAGWFDRVEFVSIPSEEVRVQALAEGLVDVADLRSDALRGTRDFVSLPEQVVHRDIGLPSEIGTRNALDDWRMAARWWRV